MVIALLFGSGCTASVSFGGDFGTAAERLIEGELSEGGIEFTAAACDNPAGREPGTIFRCTAESRYGEVVLRAEILPDDADDDVQVNTENLMLADQIPGVEADLAAAISRRAGVDIGVEYVDCGRDPVVLTSASQFSCLLTDPTDGDLHDVTITVSNLNPGPPSMSYEISDASGASS